MIVESYEDVIALSGALHSNQWDTLHTAISLLLKRHPEGVVIDCSGLTDCNMMGADTFHNVINFLKNHDARVIVAAVPAPVMHWIKQVPDVRSQLPIAPSVEAARNSLYLLNDRDADDYIPTKKKKNRVEATNQFLVVLNGTECDKWVLSTAREMGDGMNAMISVMFPIIVPRDMPLQSPMPEIEIIAQKLLNDTNQALEKAHFQHEVYVERARDIPSAIQDVLKTYPATHVIVGLPQCDGEHDQVAAKLIKLTLEKVSSAVIFVRGPKA